MKKLNDIAILHKLLGTDPSKKEDVQPKEALSYSFAGLGQNIICQLVTTFFMMYMTDVAGVSAMWLSWMFLCARLFDAFNDPIMGSIVEMTRSKYGKMRPYLKYSPIPIAIFTVLLFISFGDSISQVGQFIYSTVIYLCWGIAYTSVDVPYWGLSTTMTNNTTKRGNLLTIARLFCTAGAGLVTILVPQITAAVTKQYHYTTADGKSLVNPIYAVENATTLKYTYFIIAIVLVILSLPMFYIGFKNTKERCGTIEDNQKLPSLGHNLKLLFKNKELMLIVLSGILGGARMVYTYTGGLYFCKYALGDEGAYSLLTMLVVPGGLIASVLCPWLTKKFTKKWSFIGSHIIGAIAMVVMFFMWDFDKGALRGTNGTAGLVVCVVCMLLIGIPQGISNIMTYAMIGDTVEYLEWKTGERAEGICFAMQTLINKIGMAIGAFIGVIAYRMSGISPSNPEGSMTVDGLNKLWLMLVLSGVVSFIACVIPMFFYTITEDKQRWLVEQINLRKAESATQAEVSDTENA